MGRLYGFHDPTPTVFEFGVRPCGTRRTVMIMNDVGFELEVPDVTISEEDLERLSSALQTAFEEVFKRGIEAGAGLPEDWTPPWRRTPEEGGPPA